MKFMIKVNKYKRKKPSYKSNYIVGNYDMTEGINTDTK